jgi:UDP-N-acetylmuramoylalanine--D-glutamate ligase
MNIAIVGYDRQGRSAFEYWNKPENTLTICDQNYIEDTPPGIATKFGGDYLNNLYEFDLIVRTPGLHPSEIVENNQEDPNILAKVTTVTNEFFKVCPSKRIIGVTGTKGKGTTSTLIAKFLEAAGLKTHLGGNIGIAPLEMLKAGIEPDDWVILELANFQLVDLKYSPHIAVCLMIAPEHLDWHDDMYEYVQAKRQLFVHQSTHDIAVFNARNMYAQEIADASPAFQIGYEVPPEDEKPENMTGAYVDGSHICFENEKICHVSDVVLPGRHNLENVCAAISTVYPLIAQTQKHPHAVIKAVLKSFAGLPHRIENLGQSHDIWFINDSFAVNPDATIAAIRAIDMPQILIVGGFDRGLDISRLINEVKSNPHVKKVLAVGKSGPRIAEAFKAQGMANYQLSTAETMPAVVAEAVALARKGDAVVLSPAFPSFDMFKDFEDRGNQFKAAVKAL